MSPLALFVVFVLVGQDAPPPENPAAVDEVVVVTASRLEELLDDVPTHTTVIDEADLAGNASLTVDDALRKVPGFSLFRRNGSLVAHPTTQGVSLRGIGPSGVSRTLVLLDGVPLNDPFGGWVYWSRVPATELERIEIVRGGGSSAWGSSALGGVVQLITHRPRDGRFDLRAQGGERGTGAMDATWSDRVADVGYALGGRWFESDGYPVVRADQRGPIDIPATSEHRSLRGSFDTDLGDAWRLGGRLEGFEEERGNGTPLTGNDTELQLFSTALDRAGPHHQLQVRIFGQRQEFASTFSAQEEDRSGERPALDQFLVDTDSLAASVQWTGLFGRQTIVAGGELRSTEGATNELFFFTDDGFSRLRIAGGDERLAGIYLHDSIRLGDRVELDLGLRADRWRSDDGVRRELALADGAVRRDDRFDRRSETELSPRLGVVVSATPHWAFSGALYRSFRAPTVNELYRPFRVRNDITEANAALVPESLSGGELGARYRSGRVRASAFVFSNEIDDAVTNLTLALGPGVIAPCGFVPGGGSCRQRRNLDRVRVEGFELDVEGSPSDRVELGLSYLLSRAEVREASEAPELVGRAVPQVPEDQITASAQLRPLANADRLLVGLQARWVGSQFEDDQNLRELDSFASVDMLARLRLNERWSVFAAAENAFDESIEAGKTAEGLVTIGAPRTARLGVELSLRR